MPCVSLGRNRFYVLISSGSLKSSHVQKKKGKVLLVQTMGKLFAASRRELECWHRYILVDPDDGFYSWRGSKIRATRIYKSCICELFVGQVVLSEVVSDVQAAMGLVFIRLYGRPNTPILGHVLSGKNPHGITGEDTVRPRYHQGSPRRAVAGCHGGVSTHGHGDRQLTRACVKRTEAEVGLHWRESRTEAWVRHSARPTAHIGRLRGVQLGFLTILVCELGCDARSTEEGLWL